MLEVENPDIVALQVTKIDNSIPTSEFFPENSNYSVFRNDRTLHGGGVVLLVNKDLNHMPMAELEDGSESVWAKVTINGTPHYVSSWYRQPSSPPEEINMLKDQIIKN